MTTLKLQDRLNGAQRNYKVSGKKLLPRDPYQAQFGARNTREFNRVIAKEIQWLVSRGGIKAYFKAKKLERHMGNRRAKCVQLMIENLDNPHTSRQVMEAGAFMCLGNAQWRYFQALLDQQTLGNT